MNTATDNELVRQQSFDCTGPVELEIELDAGLIEIRLAEDAESVVHIEVRVAPSAAGPWGGGLTGLLSWVGSQFGSWAADLPETAVRETTITKHGQRVMIRGPKAMPLQTVPLGVVVLAPPGSALMVRTRSADIQVSGTAGRCDLQASSGNISVDRAEAAVRAQTGSGAVRLGPVTDELLARSGSGDVEVSSLIDNATITTGSGDVWLGSVHGGEVNVKAGSGDVTIADVADGRLALVAGSGDLRVGIRSGVVAELDVFSGSGRARSELPVTDEQPPVDAQAVVRVRARSGSGDAVITRATA